jgi:hypothetical protein
MIGRNRTNIERKWDKTNENELPEDRNINYEIELQVVKRDQNEQTEG